MDNAFDPDNTHLWVRCKAHEKGTNGPDYCIFVEGCSFCLEDCEHFPANHGDFPEDNDGV